MINSNKLNFCARLNSNAHSSHTASLATSEEDEDLSDVAFDVLDFLADHIEADGLGEGSALADSHDVSDGEAESG